VNFQTNGRQKVALTDCWISSETLVQSTDLQIQADHEVPHWRKQGTIWLWVKISRRLTERLGNPDNWLRCYEITTMSLVR